MANEFITPNMNLPSPVPGQAPGPTWAQDNFNCLNLIDSHNHTTGQGVQIQPGGLNINADLPFNGNNAISIRSARFAPRSAPLSGGSDIGCLYEAGVDLYYNDGSGNQIRITQGGSISGASGTITGLPSGTASAAFSAASGTFIFQQATSTAANVDVGAVIVRYPGSYPTPAGNYIAIQAPSSLASAYALTLPALPAQTNLLTLGTTGTISSTTWDVVGQNMTSVGANAVANSRTRATGTTVAAGGVAISNGVTASVTSNSFTTFTGASVTITTTGRPVIVMVEGDGSGYPKITFTCGPSGTGNDFSVQFARDSSFHFSVYNTPTLANSTTQSQPPYVYVVDVVGAGTHTYELQGASSLNASQNSVSVSDIKLVAYEL